jgi:hypothetical protein
VAVAALAALGASLPFLVAGRAGILGVGDNDDMSAHLTAAWALTHHEAVPPVGATNDPLFAAGYPLGPHALAAALAAGLHVSLVHAFGALTLTVPVLASLAALAAMPESARRAIRGGGALLVGLCYLAAAYLGQGAFKETLMGLAVVAFAVALRAGAGPLPLGLLGGGAVYVYSYPGVAWLAGTALVALAGRWREWRRALPAIGIALLVAAPEAGHVYDFVTSPFAHEPDYGTGNLFRGLPAAQVLGIWPNGDYRLSTRLWPLTSALDVAALLTLAWALRWWWRRRDLAPPAAAAVAALLALDFSITRNVYNTGKALAILAPAVALTLAVPLAAAWPSRRAARAAALVLGLAAAWSSGLVLREAHVGPTDRYDAAHALAATVPGAHVLSLTTTDFNQWILRGTRAATPPLLYSPEVVPPARPWHPPAPFEFASFTPATLDRFDYVLASSAAHPSRRFHAVRRRGDFVLYRRGAPAAPPCRHEAVVAGRLWHGQPAAAGRTGTRTIRVPAGTWDVSVQYVSRTGIDLRIGAWRARLPASQDRLGTFWPAGRLTVPRSQVVRVVATARGTSWLGRLLGADAFTRALNAADHHPLGRLALRRCAPGG